VSNSDLSVDSVVLEPATPELVPAEPQPVDATGQPIPTPEPTDAPEVTPQPEPEPEVVVPGLAMAAPAYKQPAADFEHTAYNPENVQNIS
jgi:hypothetical protein